MIMVHVLSTTHQSRPGPSTERYRCALPHGKAFTGRATLLSPAWCTAVGLLHGRFTSEAAVAAEGRQTASQASWLQSSPRPGRGGAALPRGRAFRGQRGTVPVTLYHPFTAADRCHGAHSQVAGDAEDGRQQQSPCRQSRAQPRAGRSGAALLRWRASSDRVTRYVRSGAIPPYARGEGRSEGLFGASSGCCNGPGGPAHSKPG